MRVHAVLPPGIRQARSRHSLPPLTTTAADDDADDAPPTRAHPPVVTSARAVFPKSSARTQVCVQKKIKIKKNYNSHKPTKKQSGFHGADTLVAGLVVTRLRNVLHVY